MNKQKLRYKFILFDVIASVVVWVIFMLFRRTVNDAQIFSNIQIFVPNYNFYLTLFIFPISCLFVNYLSGFYLNPERKSGFSVILTTIFSSIIISISIFFGLLLDDIVVSYEYYYYSLFVLFFLNFFFSYIARFMVYADIKTQHKKGNLNIKVIVVGTGRKAIEMAEAINKNSDYSEFVGYVAVDQIISVEKDQIIGSISQLDLLIPKYQIQEAIIALDQPDEQKLFTYINALYRYNIDIKFTPRLYEILTGSARIGSMGMSPLVSITNLNMPDWQVSVKRLLDVIVSALALIVISPIVLFFIYKIKKDSKGPAFYTQERIGLYGKAFNIIKFRTMHVGSEAGMPKLSSASDDRITDIGRIMRRYRIDELPQFWNILKGDMSLVGPRPERRFYINQIIEQAPYYCLLYKIRPGLTSWGPIKIGYTDTIDKMVERLNYDIIYIENMSLLNDFKILILTLEIIFSGKGV